MSKQTKPGRPVPAYARSVKTTISLPMFMLDDGVARMHQYRIFKFSQYVQLLIQKDTIRKDKQEIPA